MYTVSLNFVGENGMEKDIRVGSRMKPELNWALKVCEDRVIYILRIEDILMDTTKGVDFISCKCRVLKKIYEKGDKNE